MYGHGEKECVSVSSQPVGIAGDNDGVGTDVIGLTAEVEASGEG